MKFISLSSAFFLFVVISYAQNSYQFSDRGPLAGKILKVIDITHYDNNEPVSLNNIISVDTAFYYANSLPVEIRSWNYSFGHKSFLRSFYTQSFVNGKRIEEQTDSTGLSSRKIFYNENGLPDSSIASNSYQHNIKYTYSWDEHKRELKVSYLNNGKKLNEQEAYSFNKDGLLNSYLSHTIIDRRQTYIYRKFDKNGNWTQRFTTSYQDVYIGAKVTHQITERSIIYYPD